LKTAVLTLVTQLGTAGRDLRSPQLRSDLAASFQQAVVDVLVEKTAAAALAVGAEQVCLCGGVSANQRLRQQASERMAALGIPLYIPPLAFCTDNAAMIAAAAYYHPTVAEGLALDVQPSLLLLDSVEEEQCT
jgi:N6-L-threonylcarbamoyladenine synthase